MKKAASAWWVATKSLTPEPKRKFLTIEEAKARVSMLEVLVRLARPEWLEGYWNQASGEKWLVLSTDGNWKAIKCPFHEDSHASASYNGFEGRFRCHACDIGGDVIDVVKDRLDTDTKGALAWLGALVHD